MHKKSSGPAPIRVVSQNAVWRGIRFPHAFVWVFERELPQLHPARSKFKAILTGLPLSPRQLLRWHKVMHRLSDSAVSDLVAHLDGLSPEQRFRVCNL